MNLKLDVKNTSDEIINKENLNNLNELRSKAKIRTIISVIVGIIGLLVINIAIDNFVSIILSFVLLVGLVIFAGKPYAEFRGRYKELFVQTSLEEIFDNLQINEMS